MDIHNNYVGRQIGEKNPNVSPEKAAELVQLALDNGELVIIDSSTGEIIPSTAAPERKDTEASEDKDKENKDEETK